ncbi:unnamed protein product [Phytophthora lilii]|uniref:Unnamed protein product n=1 Tax=Phytophthora lilii TaxID=2077276 RepID=A0A9W6X4Z0_9STRA|nr:unnamed protein product [Phytophthora lilii]
MVKLTLTIAAAMAATAALADVGFPKPKSPLAQRGPFFRQGGAAESSMDFGRAGSNADVPSPYDFSASVDGVNSGVFRGRDRPDPSDAGSLGRSINVGHKGDDPWQGSSSMERQLAFPTSTGSDDMLPPSAGSEEMPPFPDGDHFGRSHRKALSNDTPDLSPRHDGDPPHHGNDVGSGSLWLGSGSADGYASPPPEAGLDDTPSFPGRGDQGSARNETVLEEEDGHKPNGDRDSHHPPASQEHDNAEPELPSTTKARTSKIRKGEVHAGESNPRIRRRRVGPTATRLL